MLPRKRDEPSQISSGSSRPARPRAFGGVRGSQEDIAMEGIQASVDFLLEALAEDLNAPIPSKERAFLQVANDRVCLVRSLVERLEAARGLVATVENHFGTQGPTTTHYQ